MTFIQPSSKLLPIELKCSIVTIVKQSNETCFEDQEFHLISSNSLNNISSSSSVLLLPYSLPHNLQPKIRSKCSANDFIYSYYLLSIDPSQWKYSRTTKQYSNSSFQETFLENYCSQFSSKSILTIQPKTLSYGYYISVFTISSNSNPSDFRQLIQPIEIIRSDLITTFNGNQTITDEINFDFYSTTIDPDQNDFHPNQLNFTLICYPESLQSSIFQPNVIQLGSSRPTETNPQNINPWSIQWSKLNLIFHRMELNLQVYENQCFISEKQNRTLIQWDLNTKILNIKENDLISTNETLYFLLIVRHLIDGRQIVARFDVDKELNTIFDTNNLNVFEEAMENLNDLASSNPNKAVELITNLADKMNQISENSVRYMGSSQVSSKFEVFSEILACNCALVFLEHHQPTQHGCHSLFV